jgi:hypothetical protein
MNRIAALASVLVLSVGAPPALAGAYDIPSGPNTITGVGAAQINGQAVTCAGRKVSLSDPRSRSQNDQLATNNVALLVERLRTLDMNDYVASFQDARITVCDEQGRFSFPDVADGTYRVTTSMTWSEKSGKPGHESTAVSQQTMVKTITVSGGTGVEVLLTVEQAPPRRR